MATRVVQIHDPAEWDAALVRSPGVDLLQSWKWGEFKRASGGWKPTRLMVQRDGEPLAGIQLLTRRVMGAPSYYGPRGPWWLDDEQALAVLVPHLRRTLRLHAPYLRIDPPVSDASLLQRLGFRPAPRQIQPRATIVVDLTPTEDELLARFDRQVRYNARLATRKGVEVVQGGLAEVKPFWELLAQTAERKGFPERELPYFEQLVTTYGDDAAVFLAHYEGQLVYGAITVRFGPVAYYLYGASGGDRSVKPSELVQVHAMRWAKERGATRYDMWGIPTNRTPENPLYGVYRFKSGFGGQPVEYAGALDLPLIPLAGSAPSQLEVLALKTITLARGGGFHLVDHLA